MKQNQRGAFSRAKETLSGLRATGQYLQKTYLLPAGLVSEQETKGSKGAFPRKPSCSGRPFYSQETIFSQGSIRNRTYHKIVLTTVPIQELSLRNYVLAFLLRFQYFKDKLIFYCQRRICPNIFKKKISLDI